MVDNIMPSFWLLQRVGGSQGPTRSYILGRPYILYIFVPFLILILVPFNIFDLPNSSSGLCLEITILCHFSQGFLKCIVCSGDKVCKLLEPWERLIHLA